MSVSNSIRTSVRSCFTQRISRSFATSATASSSFETASGDASSSTAPVLPSDPVLESGSSTDGPSTLTYRIPRTASGELPVYSKLRRGNMWKTIVRNVEGDVGALQAELNSLFQQTHIDPLRPAPSVTMRPTNRHLEIKGRRVTEIKEWLEGRGH